MSANHWTICPLCEKERKEQITKHIKNVREGYKLLTKEEYLEAIRCSANEEKAVQTLREDYDIGTDADGLLSISYTCHCSKCFFTYSFNHEQELVNEPQY